MNRRYQYRNNLDQNPDDYFWARECGEYQEPPDPLEINRQLKEWDANGNPPKGGFDNWEEE